MSLQPQMSSLCRHFSSPCSPSRSYFRLNSSSAGLELISGCLRLGGPSLAGSEKAALCSAFTSAFAPILELKRLLV